MKILRLALLVGASGLVLFAQQTAISGAVADQSGAVIAGAAVRLIPVSGGAVASTITTPSGTYSFPSLQATTYKVRVEVPGFTPAE
ncbi:MAG: carboxypeptidase-like regulatory domain-containing protein, partial [Acidobacteria bacterium]|nr:carboxypeptidase-like regulatory domain-containing protein [Acidobacteriota bacterium]